MPVQEGVHGCWPAVRSHGVQVGRVATEPSVHGLDVGLGAAPGPGQPQLGLRQLEPGHLQKLERRAWHLRLQRMRKVRMVVCVDHDRHLPTR